MTFFFRSARYKQFFPLIFLVSGTVFIGGYLMVRKGIVNLPILVSNRSVVQLEHTSAVNQLLHEGEYALSYADMDPELLVDIATFGKDEHWQGSGKIEDDITQGGPVMFLIDRNRQTASSVLLKHLNLASIDTIKLTVNFNGDVEDIESLNLLFGNADGTSFYRFPLSRFQPNLNTYTLPKDHFSLISETERDMEQVGSASAVPVAPVSWENIERTVLELVSRPDSKISVDVGWIRGEKAGVFENDWRWDGNGHFLNLFHTPDGKLALKALTIGRGVGILKTIGSVKDFVYSVKITSFKEGYLGILFRGDYQARTGYYLTVGGIRTNEWNLSKYYNTGDQLKRDDVIKGQISNFEFHEHQPFWLKVVVRGSTIGAYFSLDGTQYTLLGEANDTELTTGGVGIAASGGGGIFDHFTFSLL